MSSQPDPLLDPIEALVHIRTLVEATADLTYGTKAEPTIREIMRILDKALPSRRLGHPTKRNSEWVERLEDRPKIAG